MNAEVKNAVLATLKEFATLSGNDKKELETELLAAFGGDADYLKKVDALDAAFDNHPEFEELREPFFDLLLINFFNEDVSKLESDYLDSPEWEAIEEQTLDRGTELLNLLLYLKECRDEDIEPELDDFLREFLLVDEDEFQDEHRIYEDVIANQILIESSPEEIARVSKELPESSEMKELFYPVMAFFQEQQPDDSWFKSFVKSSDNKAFDAAIYRLLISYN